MTVPKRQIALATLVAFLATILAACGGAPGTAPSASPQVIRETVVVEQTVVVQQVVEQPVLVTPTAGPTAEPSEELAADQTLRYVTRNYSRLDPASEGGFGRFIISHLWMPLFLRDSEGNIQPWLATGYEASTDGTVYTVSINPNAVWSDGSPVTAQEAKDYWTYGLDPKRFLGQLRRAIRKRRKS